MPGWFISPIPTATGEWHSGGSVSPHCHRDRVGEPSTYECCCDYAASAFAFWPKYARKIVAAREGGPSIEEIDRDVADDLSRMRAEVGNHRVRVSAESIQ